MKGYRNEIFKQKHGRISSLHQQNPKVREPVGGLHPDNSRKLDRDYYLKRQVAGGGVVSGISVQERNWSLAVSSLFHPEEILQ